MHEHGLIRKLLERALAEAGQREGRLTEVRVRLGALAASDPDHFREDFAHVCTELGVTGVSVQVDVAPDHPAGIELLSVGVTS